MYDFFSCNIASRRYYIDNLDASVSRLTQQTENLFL